MRRAATKPSESGNGLGKRYSLEATAALFGLRTMKKTTAIAKKANDVPKRHGPVRFIASIAPKSEANAQRKDTTKWRLFRSQFTFIAYLT